MQKSIILSLAMVLFCALSAFSQEKQTRKLDSFTAISYGVPGRLHIKQGSTQEVVLRGDKEDLDKIETRVSGNKLTIKTESRWWKWDSDNVDIYITVTSLEALQVSGSGKLTGETPFKTQNFDLTVSGSGNVQLEVLASGKISSRISGSGNIDLKGRCRTYDNNISGSGRLDINLAVENDVYFGISGSGKINAAGSSRSFKAEISGSGRLAGIDFETKRCEVRISGSGGVELSVTDEIDARISGSGSLSYKGNPSKVNSQSSGSGKVRKI